jgi:hypothetical protein
MRAKLTIVVCALALIATGCGRGPTAPTDPLPSGERDAGPMGMAPTVTGGSRVLGLRATMVDGSLIFSGTSEVPPDSLNRYWVLRASIHDHDSDSSGRILACDSRFMDAAGGVIVYLLDPDAEPTAIGSATLSWHGRRFRLAVPLLGRTSGSWFVYAFRLPEMQSYTVYAGTFGDARSPSGTYRSSR